MYQVSFNSLPYFQRYALDKLFTAKIKMESNSVNTGDRAMVLAFCKNPSWPSISVSSFIKIPSILSEICLGQKGLQMYTLFFLFLLKNIDCGYFLEPPR